MIFYFARVPLIRLFTNDPEVEALALEMFYILIIHYFADCVQGCIQGVIRALDAQKEAQYIAIGAYYIVSIPLACIFTFYVKMDVRGLWIALAAGTAVQAILYVRLVLKLDWQVVADAAQKRIAKDNNELGQTEQELYIR